MHLTPGVGVAYFILEIGLMASEGVPCEEIIFSPIMYPCILG